MSTGGVQEDYIKKAKDIYKLLNEFRKNPKGFARHLEKMKSYLDKKSNVLSEPGKIQVQMVEGETVFNEAIEFLNSLPLLKPLEWDENLAASAMYHVMDIGPKGLLSYQSADGTEPEERISKYGNYVESLGENIDFGPNDCMGVLISLTLDDGEPDRPHRDNLFKLDYLKVGIACGPHKSEYQMCVMDFAYDFSGFGEEEIEEDEKTPNKHIPIQNNNLNSFNTNSNNNQSPLVRLSLDNDEFKNYKQTELDNYNRKMTGNFGGSGGVIQNNNNNMLTTLNPNAHPNNVGINPHQNTIPSSTQMNSYTHSNYDEEIALLVNQVRHINLEKKVVSKLVEVTTKIVYTYEDGSSKEVVEKQNHNYDFTG